MAYTNDWNENSPVDHSKFIDQPGHVRTSKSDIAERLKDMIYGFIAGETEEGQIKKLPMKEQASDPTNVTDVGIFYTKEVDSITEVFYIDDTGQVIQITDDGKIKGVSSGVSKDITQTAHGFSVGDILRWDTSTSKYIEAKGDTAENAEVIGIVKTVEDADNFIMQTGGYIDTLSGLVAGDVYFLSEDTAGLLTTTEPTTLNAISRPMLIAVSTTAGYILPYRGKHVTGVTAEANKLIQIVNTTHSGLKALGSAAMVVDNSKPLWDEGNIVTELDTAITPTSATNKLRIEVAVNVDIGADYPCVMALFQDPTGTDPAIAGIVQSGDANLTNGMMMLTLDWFMTAGTTSETTFKIRIGAGTSTNVWLNGYNNGQIFDGIMASSITISEIQS